MIKDELKKISNVMKKLKKNSSINYSFKDAIKLHEQGQLHNTKELCEKILERTSNHIDAINLLCLVSYQLKDINSAIKFVSQAIQISPNNAAFYCNRGILLSEQKNYNQSIKDYDKAIELQPNAPEPYLNRANCLQNLRQFEASIQDYDLAINLKPDLGEAYFNRGNALKKLKLLRDAVYNYGRALQLSPNLPFLFGTYFQTLMMCSNWTDYSSNLSLYEYRIEEGMKVAIPFEPLAFTDKPHLHLKAAKVFSQYNYPSTAPNLVRHLPKNQKIYIGYFSAEKMISELINKL
jgi:tetratricopeptide (TPR) repeat protein